MRQLLIVLLAALAGCTTSTPARDAGMQPEPDAGSPAPPDAGPPVDAGPRLDDVLIYAHSRDALYTFSAYTNTVTEIGEFRTADGDDAPPVLDLAVDSEGVVVISTDDWDEVPPTLYQVDPLTAVVTPIGELRLDTERERLFALSFLAPDQSPDGTEMLIGATNEGACYRVDRDDASAEWLGNYPDGWASSGDIVSVDGLGTFATLRDNRDIPFEERFPGDVLARIIFASDGSSAVTVIGAIKSDTEDFRSLYGLGYWGRNLYGFSSTGQLIRIDRESGRASLVSTETGTSQFWGAGVTVDVPFLF